MVELSRSRLSTSDHKPNIYSQTCIKRSPFGQWESGLRRQVTSKKTFNSYEFVYDRTRKCDLLIQVTTKYRLPVIPHFLYIYIPPAWFHALIPTSSVMVTKHLPVHGLGFHPSGHSEMSRHYSCIKSGNHVILI